MIKSESPVLSKKIVGSVPTRLEGRRELTETGLDLLISKCSKRREQSGKYESVRQFPDFGLLYFPCSSLVLYKIGLVSDSNNGSGDYIDPPKDAGYDHVDISLISGAAVARAAPLILPAMSVHEPTNEDDFDELLKTDKVVVVDFYATWCGPCKIMGPKFQKMAGEFANAVFVKVDVDECEDIVSRYDIKVMPTFIFIKNKQQVDIVEGNVEDQLRARLAQHAA